MPIKGYPDNTTLTLVAGRLFGPRWSAQNEVTSDDIISALDTVMNIYYNVTGGRNWIRPGEDTDDEVY
jgi:hypothetical protein